jgi:uncharacterized protein (TIGR00251 family)
MTQAWCSAVPAGIRLAVQVAPNAKKSEVAGALGDVLKIRLQAAPIEGKANEALIRYIADMLDVPKSAVHITHGHTSKRKIIEIIASHLTVDRVRQALIPSDEK